MAQGASPAAPSLRLFHARRSRSFRALWMLEELAIPYQIDYLDLGKGEQKAPGFLAINPSGKVPTLLDGDVVISESGAICAYLADRYPAARLAPQLDSPARGAYLKWLFYAAGCMEPALTDHALKRTAPPARAAWGEYDAMVAIVAGAVGRDRYLLGDWFTAADIMVGSIVRFGIAMKLLPPRDEFAGYVERLAQRPAFQRALASDLASRTAQ